MDSIVIAGFAIIVAYILKGLLNLNKELKIHKILKSISMKFWLFLGFVVFIIFNLSDNNYKEPKKTYNNSSAINQECMDYLQGIDNRSERAKKRHKEMTNPCNASLSKIKIEAE